MLRAVIFDFDGVITDSEILHLRAFNQSLAQYSVEITKNDYYTTYLGLNDNDCYRLLIEKGLLKMNEQQINAIMTQKKKIFEQLAKTEGKMIEGVRDFLSMLEQNNIPMAICSGALLTEVEMVLDEARLRDLFEVIVSGEQVKKGKPNPEGFLLTLQRLNENRKNPITGKQCIAIEDSRWGLKAAKAAGMHTIAVTNSYDAGQLSMADKIVDRLNDLSIDDLHRICA